MHTCKLKTRESFCVSELLSRLDAWTAGRWRKRGKAKTKARHITGARLLVLPVLSGSNGLCLPGS